MNKLKGFLSRLIPRQSHIPNSFTPLETASSFRTRSLTGFTLIEMLVVISIILIITTMTLLVLPVFMKDEGLKRSAQLVRGVFTQGRQLASSQRVTQFVLFTPDKGMMTLYCDTDENDTFEKDSDEQIDEPLTLFQDIVFVSDPNGLTGPPLFRLAEPYLGFRTDGSLMLPAGISDMSLASPPQEATTDIVLREKNRNSRVYLDFEELSGMIRKIYYQEE